MPHLIIRLRCEEKHDRDKHHARPQCGYRASSTSNKHHPPACTLCLQPARTPQSPRSRAPGHSLTEALVSGRRRRRRTHIAGADRGPCSADVRCVAARRRCGAATGERGALPTDWACVPGGAAPPPPPTLPPPPPPPPSAARGRWRRRLGHRSGHRSGHSEGAVGWKGCGMGAQ